VSLAEAIAQLVNDTPLRQSMGTAGRLLAENTFDIEQNVDYHMKLYAEIDPV
jgi:glycosyltransferase involved in cell wall biosynthesis